MVSHTNTIYSVCVWFIHRIVNNWTNKPVSTYIRLAAGITTVFYVAELLRLKSRSCKINQNDKVKHSFPKPHSKTENLKNGFISMHMMTWAMTLLDFWASLLYCRRFKSLAVNWTSNLHARPQPSPSLALVSRKLSAVQQVQRELLLKLAGNNLELICFHSFGPHFFSTNEYIVHFHLPNL